MKDCEVQALRCSKSIRIYRPLKPQPDYHHATHPTVINGVAVFGCIMYGATQYDWKAPYAIGEILYVREAFSLEPGTTPDNYDPESDDLLYRADGSIIPCACGDDPPWSPSVHMPMWAARYHLIPTAIKIKRVDGIWNWDYTLDVVDKSLLARRAERTEE
jgi:hypothetical protein